MYVYRLFSGDRIAHGYLYHIRTEKLVTLCLYLRKIDDDDTVNYGAMVSFHALQKCLIELRARLFFDGYHDQILSNDMSPLLETLSYFSAACWTFEKFSEKDWRARLTKRFLQKRVIVFPISIIPPPPGFSPAGSDNAHC